MFFQVFYVFNFQQKLGSGVTPWKFTFHRALSENIWEKEGKGGESGEEAGQGEGGEEKGGAKKR